METKKIDPQDLKRLQDLNQEAGNIIIWLGQIEIEKSALEAQKTQLLNNFSQLQKIQDEIIKKYGEGTVNLDTGEIK